MAVRNEDQINVFKRGEFVLRFFENRIRQPRIDEQNFAARRDDLESRLPVPGELGVHESHQTEKPWFGKGQWRDKITNAKLTNDEQLSSISHRLSADAKRHGRGAGVGRTIGAGLGLGVGLGRGVAVGVGLDVGVDVGVGVVVTVGVGVTVAVAVALDVAVAVAVGVAVGVGVGLAVAVAVGVGVGGACAQYLPPVFV